MANDRVLATAVFTAVTSGKIETCAKCSYPTETSDLATRLRLPVQTQLSPPATSIEMISGLGHAVQNIWEAGRAVIACTMGNYIRKNGSQVSPSCTGALKGKADGKVADCQIHMDIAPVFA